LAAKILLHSRTAVAASSTAVIDQVGILRATLIAMRRAILRLQIEAPILVDGRDVPPGVWLPVTPVIGGDRKIPQIAAASIVAKTCRDRIMTLLSARYGGYCWEQNMGYGTAQHLAGIAAHGVTAHHRKSFKPILQQSFSLDGLSTECGDAVPDELTIASSG
jgi:ribonuclease HII